MRTRTFSRASGRNSFSPMPTGLATFQEDAPAHFGGSGRSGDLGSDGQRSHATRLDRARGPHGRLARRRYQFRRGAPASSRYRRTAHSCCNRQPAGAKAGASPRIGANRREFQLCLERQRPTIRSQGSPDRGDVQSHAIAQCRLSRLRLPAAECVHESSGPIGNRPQLDGRRCIARRTALSRVRLGPARAAGLVGDGTRRARGRRSLAGCRALHRLAGLAKAARPSRASDQRGGAGLLRRRLRRTLRHAGQLGHPLAQARPAARGLALHARAQVLRHDHSGGVRRARLLLLCAIGGDPPRLHPLDIGGCHGDGAELAGPGRAPAAVRDRGAEALLAAEARRPARDPLCADEQRSRLRRRLNGGRGRRRLGRRANARAAAELAQAV